MSKEIINFEGKRYRKEVLSGGEIKLTPIEPRWGDVFEYGGWVVMITQYGYSKGTLINVESGNRLVDEIYQPNAHADKDSLTALIYSNGGTYLGHITEFLKEELLSVF
ncbi:hypothetical protein [Bacillus cereus]|uniref:hypothetical protein n=1 Tax=Bacillus cereus TaxID=1396 RepID=UPI0013D503D8|nr:hypothetical protein [Bacillus cereus]